MSETERQLVRQIYSEVLFDLAEQNNELEEVVEDLECVGNVLREEAEFAALLSSEVITGDEKSQIIRRVFGGKVSELSLNFMVVLARRGRMAFLSGISDRYRMLVDAYRERVLIEVTLPKEPSDEQSRELKKELAQAVKSEVKLAIDVDPEIIGGIIIKKGDKVIDNSVRTALKRAVEAVIAQARTRPEKDKDKDTDNKEPKDQKDRDK